jgi:hypothetical protein
MILDNNNITINTMMNNSTTMILDNNNITINTMTNNSNMLQCWFLISFQCQGIWSFGSMGMRIWQGKPKIFHIFILGMFNDIFNSQIIKCQTTGWLVNKWIRRNVKGSRHGLIRYYCGICLEGLRKTTWNVNQGSWPLN